MASEENQVVRAAIDYLKLCEKRYPCLFWRANNVPVFDPIRKVPRTMPKGSLKGVPDILGVYHRIPVGMECKTEKGKLSQMQKIFRARFENAGGRFFTIRSVEDVQAAIRSLKKDAAEVS